MHPRQPLTSNSRQTPGGSASRPARAGILRALTLAGFMFLAVSGLRAQTATGGPETTAPEQPVLHFAGPGEGAETGPPVTITLQDALERARRNSPEYLSAVTDARNAHEDRIQARASLLPSVNTTTQELLTTGGSVLPTGRFVTNDGVHVYRAWGVFHEEVNPNLLTLTGYRRATVAEALAQAKAEIARRGLTVTVTQSYYTLVVGQRKYATAQQSLGQANEFLKTTRELEQGGEAAHSDVIKAELQAGQQQQAFQEAKLAMENARLSLAVLLFPELNENFTAVDDLDQAPPLPPFEETRAMAVRANPDLKVAMDTMREANLDVSAARNSFLPTLSVDTDYGIESNYFALQSRVAAVSDAVPPKNLEQQNNLGQFTTFNLQFPVWDWGTLRSKLHQSEWRRQQARVELTAAQRRMAASLYSAYNEATVARSEVDLLRQSADLASESFRLTTLRYRAGEATALEVVDAQNALTQARNTYDDGQARYRVALANLQTITGSF
ncbi:MAG TPA: TolC family protein [Terriglobia bacterium]